MGDSACSGRRRRCVRTPLVQRRSSSSTCLQIFLGFLSIGAAGETLHPPLQGFLWTLMKTLRKTLPPLPPVSAKDDPQLPPVRPVPHACARPILTAHPRPSSQLGELRLRPHSRARAKCITSGRKVFVSGEMRWREHCIRQHAIVRCSPLTRLPIWGCVGPSALGPLGPTSSHPILPWEGLCRARIEATPSLTISDIQPALSALADGPHPAFQRLASFRPALTGITSHTARIRKCAYPASHSTTSETDATRQRWPQRRESVAGR